MKVWYDSNKPATSFLPLRICQQNVKLGYPSNLIQEERKSVTLPGPEDGYLHMPNYLVERFMKLHLSGAQWQVLWAVWRRTLCEPWGNRSARIRLRELAADTQLHRQAVAREVSALTEMNIILRDPATSLTSFNPDPSTWVKRKVVAKSLWQSISKSGNKASTREEVI